MDCVRANSDLMASATQRRVVVETRRRVNRMLKPQRKQVELAFRSIFNLVKAAFSGDGACYRPGLGDWSFKQANEDESVKFSRSIDAA